MSNEGVEQWLPVVGWEGYYSVSNMGRVRSETRTIITRNGERRTHRSRILKSGINSSGRWSVGLSRNSKLTSRLVHQLVAEAFIPNPAGHPLVRHKDDNKDDNRASNLLWGTYSDNQLDRVRNGIYRNGMSHWTHCRRGHEYTEDNTYRPPSATNTRSCRACMRLRDAKYRKGMNE